MSHLLCPAGMPFKRAPPQKTRTVLLAAPSSANPKIPTSHIAYANLGCWKLCLTKPSRRLWGLFSYLPRPHWHAAHLSMGSHATRLASSKVNSCISCRNRHMGSLTIPHDSQPVWGKPQGVTYTPAVIWPVSRAHAILSQPSKMCNGHASTARPCKHMCYRVCLRGPFLKLEKAPACCCCCPASGQPMPASCAEPAHLCCCAIDDGDGEVVCLALRCGPPVGSIAHAAGLLLLPETAEQQ